MKKQKKRLPVVFKPANICVFVNLYLLSPYPTGARPGPASPGCRSKTQGCTLWILKECSLFINRNVKDNFHSHLSKRGFYMANVNFNSPKLFNRLCFQYFTFFLALESITNFFKYHDLYIPFEVF